MTNPPRLLFVLGADKKITEVEIDTGNGKVLATDRDDEKDEKGEAGETKR